MVSYISRCLLAERSGQTVPTQIRLLRSTLFAILSASVGGITSLFKFLSDDNKFLNI